MASIDNVKYLVEWNKSGLVQRPACLDQVGGGDRMKSLSKYVD
jgi:hypothetical protein